MQKAIFIGIDGVQLEKLRLLDLQGRAPELNGLDMVESYIGGQRGTATEQPTVSGPGWSTLLTGVWDNKHHVVTNNGAPIEASVDSVFERVDRAIPNAEIASVVHWSDINTGHFALETGKLGQPAVVDTVVTGIGDQAATDTAVQLINDKAPDFMFVHLDDPDGVGHGTGFGEAYDASIETASRHVGEILAAVNAREAAYPDEDWLVIVSTDHGRTHPDGGGHGGQSEFERRTFIASNKELGQFDEPVPATSVVATILDHLNIDWQPGTIESGSLLEGAGDPIAPVLRDVVSPEDESAFVPVDADLVVDFSEAVQKGEGSVRIHRQSDGSIVDSIDVNSDAVTIDGARVTIDPGADLQGRSGYYVTIDAGAFTDGKNAYAGLDDATVWNFETDSAAPLETIFREDWESAADRLQPFESTSESGGDGTDWTPVLPDGWTMQTTTPSGGPVEFHGWTLLDVNSWVKTAGDQGRSEFLRGNGVVVVADPDEYDDLNSASTPLKFNATLNSPTIDISGADADSLRLAFDSSWMPEGSQEVRITVSYDGGPAQEVMRWTSGRGDQTYHDVALNEHVVLDLDNPEGATSMTLSFSMPQAGNNWFWAIDNIEVQKQASEVSDNTAPEAVTDSYAVDEAATLTVTAAQGLLANDSDADGHALTVIDIDGRAPGGQITLASGARVTVAADGSFVYDDNGAFADLNPGETAVDSFVYTTSDGHGGTATAIATIEIAGAVNVVQGTAANDRLVGTDGQDRLIAGGGRFDFLTGGGGADEFVLGRSAGNGIRDTVTVTDFEVGVDTLDLGDATVARHVMAGGSTYLFLAGGDMDTVILTGVTAADDLIFA